MRDYLLFVIITILAFANNAWGDGFAGQNQEVDGSYYLRSRFYDPQTGVFLTKDPLGIVAGTNSYIYAVNNPINCIDPLGTYAGADDLTLIGVGALGGLIFQGGSDLLHMKLSPWQQYTSTILAGSAGSWAFEYGGPLGSGAAAGLVGNASLQGLNLATGQQNSFSVGQLAINTGVGGALGLGGSKAVGALTPYLTSATKGLIGEAASYFSQLGEGNIPVSYQSDLPNGSIADWITYNPFTGETGIVESKASFTASTGSKSPQSLLTDAQQDAFNNFDNWGNNSFDSYTIEQWNGQSLLNGTGSVLGGLTANSLNVGGVLINKAATLVGTSLADIKGASYDPTTKQLIFLGTNQQGAALTTPLNMDYFYTAIQSVYGSATPPFVTLNPPAVAYTQWPLSQTFTNGSTQGFILQYDPIWQNVDTTVNLQFAMRDSSGNQYNFAYVLNCVPSPNIYNTMALVYSSTTGNPPAGVTLNTSAFSPGSIWYLSESNGQENSLWPVQLTNLSGQNLIVTSAAVIPARQHREYGGRIENTKLGWAMYEADRVMKCLSVGKDNLTGASYSSATPGMPSGYKNLLELSSGLGETGASFTRMWFEPNQVTLQSYIDPTTGKATVGFSQSSVQLLTEAYLQGLAADPAATAFVNNFTTNYSAFAAMNFPVGDSTDPTGTRIINVPIFALLQQAMQAVSLARFFHDNNIPLDQWWMSSYQPPTAYSPLSVPTATNSLANGSVTYTIYGGVQDYKPNTYIPSANAQNLLQSVANSRPAPQATDPQDVPGQVWNASDANFGNLTAVAASLAQSPQDGNVNLGGADLSFPSTGDLPLTFDRYYQSSWTGMGTMGVGWRNTRYLLQFTVPSWFDQGHILLDSSGKPLATNGNFDTQIHSGTIRMVDQSSGSYLDFNSSLSLAYGQTPQGNPQQTITGLNSNDLPTFTPGSHTSGATLIQNSAFNYVASLPDGSTVTFRPNGTLLQTTDRHGHSLYYAYDGQNRLATISDDMSPPQVITLAYNSTTGLLNTAIGPNGTQTTYQYDTTNTLLAAVLFKRSAASVNNYPIAQYTYNSANQLASVTNLSGQKPLTHNADVKGRSSTRTDLRGNVNNYSYTQVSSSSRMTSVLDPNSGMGAAQKMSDSMGRTMSTTDELGHTYSYGYNGSSLLPNSVSLPTSNRPPINISRDSYGKPTQIMDMANVGAQPINVSYDTNSQLPTQVTDEVGRVANMTYTATRNVRAAQVYHNGQQLQTVFGYDSNDHLNSVTDPLGHTTTVTQDKMGRITSASDPTGVTVSYSYDSLGRLSQINVPTSSVPITYQYDDLDRVTSVTNAMGTTTYKYDPVTTWLDSTTSTNTSGQTVQTTAYTYDTAGDVANTTSTGFSANGTPTVINTSANYTKYGDLESVTPKGAQPIDLNYNAAGQLLGTSETDVGPAVGPTIVASNASSGVWTNQNTQTFTWSVLQSSLPITGYNYAENTANAHTVTTTSTTTSWTAPDGKNTFAVEGVDSSGNWSPSTMFNLWVDTAPPLVSGVSLVPNPIPLTGPVPVTVTATVSDALSGLGTNVPQVRWCVSTNTSRTWNTALMVPGNVSNQWSATFSNNWSQFKGQTLYYQIVAQDVAGNQVISPEMSVLLNLVPHPFLFFNH